MRITSALAAIVVLLPLSAAPPRRAPASAIPNDYRAPAGLLRDNVLRIAL
jgi:hypothetical protein